MRVWLASPFVILGLLPLACGGGSSAAPGHDASTLEASAPDGPSDAPRDAGRHDAASEDSGPPVGLFGDATPDTYVAWCEAGPPQNQPLTPCSLPVVVPCGLPEGVVPGEGGALTFIDCLKICPANAMLTWDSCFVDPGDAGDSGAGGELLVQCVFGCG